MYFLKKNDKKEKKDEKTNKIIGRFCDRELSFNLYNKSISNFFSENEVKINSIKFFILNRIPLIVKNQYPGLLIFPVL